MWSEGARAVWGKTDPDSGDWLPLVQHLEDARLVAGHLWDTWLPRLVRGPPLGISLQPPT